MVSVFNRYFKLLLLENYFKKGLQNALLQFVQIYDKISHNCPSIFNYKSYGICLNVMDVFCEDSFLVIYHTCHH